MILNHDVIRPIVAVIVGLLLATWVYRAVEDPDRAERRAREEAVVMEARNLLQSYVAPASPFEIVDPLAPNHKVGKAYIFPAGDEWETAGYYRRGDHDQWHPYLMILGPDLSVKKLTVKDPDPRLVERAADDPRLSIVTP